MGIRIAVDCGIMAVVSIHVPAFLLGDFFLLTARCYYWLIFKLLDLTFNFVFAKFIKQSLVYKVVHHCTVAMTMPLCYDKIAPL